MHTNFRLENLKKWDHTQIVDIDEMIILKWILLGKMDWIYLVQDRDLWHSIVNMVIN
jgi:hypothetical protein